VATAISVTVAVISVIVAIFGLSIAAKNYNRFVSRDSREENQTEGELQSDVSYIKRRIDDVFLEQREANKTLAEHSERLTRVEESAKQAHKRIDGLEHRMDDDK